MENIDFSVAMSVYKNDNAEFFDRALESVTALQTVKPSEVVLVVDGEIDDSLNSVVEKYESQYGIFKVIRFSENQGLGNALRSAIENCSFELIARMDSDDVAVNDRFEQQLAFFERDGELDIVGGDVTEFLNGEENLIGKRSVPTSHAEISDYLKSRCPFNHPTVMYKKSAVQSAGGYIDWFWNEDYYLWLRMSLNGAKFANTGTVLVNMRSGEEQYSRRGGKKYYISEKKLQKFMLENGIIGRAAYFKNVLKRWIVQRCMPNRLRGWVFRKFAREKV